MRVVRADLHNHLRTSSCWRDGDFDKAVDTAQKRLGSGGIFGLVNFSDRRYETFSDLTGYERTFVGESQNAIYIPEKDILVVKGQEIPTKQGHLLVLGLPRDIQLKERRDLADTMKEARDNNGTIVADHPFYKEGVGFHLQKNPELVEQLDAVEVFNGEAALWIPGLTPRNANSRALEFYCDHKHLELGALTSTDGHSFDELGRNWRALDMPENYEEFITKNFRKAVKSSSNCLGFQMPGNFGYTIWVNEGESPQRFGALVHILKLGALVLGAKVPKPVRELVGLEKHYGTPRPQTLGQ